MEHDGYSRPGQPEKSGLAEQRPDKGRQPDFGSTSIIIFWGRRRCYHPFGIPACSQGKVGALIQ